MSDDTRTGAQALVATLADLGVSACFANPGTSEMHLLTALDGEARIRSVLCLFEGVVSGAADGFARVSGRPAMTLLHLGPGYHNAAANIHNAQRAGSAMVNVVGDHATYHRQYDAPLNSNIAGLAGPTSVWIGSADEADGAAELTAEAWSVSQGPVPGPVTLILPADTAWNPTRAGNAVVEAGAPAAPDSDEIARAASRIASAQKPVILINGPVLGADGQAALRRLKAAGLRVMTDTFVPKQARGAGRFHPDRMQYFAEGALDDLAGTDLMLLCGTDEPVAFFAYPDTPSRLVPEGCETLSLGGRGTDSLAAATALADALDAGDLADVAERRIPESPFGPVSVGSVAASLARHLPEQAIVSDDGVTSSLGCFLATQTAAPHDWMMLTGGAIGQGMPLAIGAAVAAPERKVICLTGDGAGLYTNQALWTMAREGLDVVVIVFVNHAYRILNIELQRTGAGQTGPTAKSLLDLGAPQIDWHLMAQSLGVSADACTSAEGFDEALARAMAEPGPRLIAVMMET